MPYLNCPECFYRVRTPMARELEGETSCPRCARLSRLVAMYATEISLRPTAEAPAMPAPESAPADLTRQPRPA